MRKFYAFKFVSASLSVISFFFSALMLTSLPLPPVHSKTRTSRYQCLAMSSGQNREPAFHPKDPQNLRAWSFMIIQTTNWKNEKIIISDIYIKFRTLLGFIFRHEIPNDKYLRRSTTIQIWTWTKLPGTVQYFNLQFSVSEGPEYR